MSGKKKLDDIMEAVTFAEVGETETASRIAAEIFPDEGGRRERILAVSAGSGFSERMIEKSVGMAERLEYGLVALSVPRAFAAWFPRLSGRRSEKGIWLPTEAFRARAEARGIPFAHASRSGDPGRAAAEVERRFRRIAFLLVEPDLAPKAGFAGVSAPIFVLADQ